MSKYILDFEKPIFELENKVAEMKKLEDSLDIKEEIKNLEEKSEIAWLRGDDKGSQKMQSEADRVRKSNPWMMRKDVNPMSKTEIELGRVNMQLEPVKRMAEIVTNTATK